MQEFGWIKGTTVKSVNPHHKIALFNKLYVAMKKKHPDKLKRADINANMFYLTVDDNNNNKKTYFFYITSASNKDTNDYTTMPTGFEHILENFDEDEQAKYPNLKPYLVIINSGSKGFLIHPLDKTTDIEKICKAFNDRKNFNPTHIGNLTYTLSLLKKRNQYVIKVKPSNTINKANSSSPQGDQILQDLKNCIEEVVEN